MSPRNVNDADYHMGHLFIDCMRQKKPEDICQVDVATGQEETNASVLSRSIRLARSLRKLGLKPGDVLALGGKNHLDLHIPYYAALMNGFPIGGVDPLFKYDEIKSLFKILQPKVTFCDIEQRETYLKIVEDLNLDTKVFSFTGEHSMANLIASEKDDHSLDEFKPTMFDLEKVYAWLVSSGGTTGVLKVAAIKHKECMGVVLNSLQKVFKQGTSTGKKIGLNLSPVQWGSGFANAVMMPLLNQVKLQTSAPATTEHVIDIINNYKPTHAFLGPSLAASIINHEKKCDFSSLDVIAMGGGKVYKEVLIELLNRKRPDALVIEAYGQTENMGEVFRPNPKGPLGNCGQITKIDKFKLVDPETGKEITEPHIPGELWSKGATFSEYYNDPEETAKAFTEDGWFRTGDILYRDEDNNLYFVERLKMLIKYRSYHVRPLELEELIRTLPGVLDVAVTAVPDLVDGEHPAACVVRKKGSNITAQEIKDLVANKLSDSKKLRGGVIFVDQIPLTSVGKVARSTLKKLVLDAIRE